MNNLSMVLQQELDRVEKIQRVHQRAIAAYLEKLADSHGNETIRTVAALVRGYSESGL